MPGKHSVTELHPDPASSPSLETGVEHVLHLCCYAALRSRNDIGKAGVSSFSEHPHHHIPAIIVFASHKKMFKVHRSLYFTYEKIECQLYRTRANA